MTYELPHDIPADFAENQTRIILDSYKKWTGQDLIAPLPEENLVHRLFHAPFVVVSSDNAPDPILNYGNKKGLELWEMSWDQLTQTPGRHTAEAMHREERQKFLDEVTRNGFVKNYSGIRISSTGKRFRIERATVWNLVDAEGNKIGQAATFSSWKNL